MSLRFLDITPGLLLRQLVIAVALVLPLMCGVAAVGSDHAAPAEAPAAEEHGAGHGDSPDSGHGDSHGEEEAEDPNSTGIKLGEFRIRSYYAVESQKSSATFTLYATAAEGKLAQSRQLLAHRKHKVRDQVILAARLVPLADFNEPDLASFRRRIVLQLRRTLPELAIENVYISDFDLKLERI
jgi:hypothetical protein